MITDLELVKRQKQAQTYVKAGKPFEAIAIYEELMRLRPDFALGHSELAMIYDQQGWQELAISHYRQALTLSPQTYTWESHWQLGNLLKTRGHRDQAIAFYQQALDLNPHASEVYQIWAKTLMESGQLGAASAVYAQAESVDLALIPAKAYNDLGVAYVQQDLTKAIAHFEKAITIQPNYADAHCNLGNALLQSGRYRDAILCFREALSIDPNFTEVYYNLGRVLVEIERFDEAIACLEAAISLKPEWAEANYNLGTALVKQNQLEQAIAAYDAAIRSKPDFAQAHWNRGYALLLQGDFIQGFREYDWRWRLKNSGFAPPRAYGQKLWDGSSLAGKTLLIYEDQGFGDMIQLVRYAPLLAQQCNRLIVICSTNLVRLFQTVAGIAEIITEGDRLPDFDLHVPMISLPRLLGTTLATVPHEVPYLSAPSAAANLVLEESKDTKLKVGIVWASGYKQGTALLRLYQEKSCPYTLFERLLEIDGVSLYSLQVGRDAGISQFKPKFRERLQDLNPLIQDFADTAALIAQLDLIITVDTAVAHLAGAMAKPVWVLLPFSPDWRWLLDRSDSPWYPTMRLFRQPQPCDWESVGAEVLFAVKSYTCGLT